jgi:hypothetical protein
MIPLRKLIDSKLAPFSVSSFYIRSALTVIIAINDYHHFKPLKNAFLLYFQNFDFMVMTIHDNLFVEDVQERFSECFPSLKIEFYKDQPEVQKRPKHNEWIDPKSRIGDIRNNHTQGMMQIKSTDRTGQVKHWFKNIFDLNVQIFRKENNCWIGTTSTNKYSLQQQSEFCELSKKCLLPKIDPELVKTTPE